MFLIPKGPPEPLVIRWLGDLVDFTLLAMGTVMVSIVAFNVAIHFIKFDVALTTELCEFLMTWVTLLGGAAAVHRGAHMTITEFIDKLANKPRFVADGAVQVFCALVSLICVYYGSILVSRTWGTELVILHWPIAVQYLALPVGFGLSLVFLCYDIVQIIRGVPRAVRYGEQEA